MPNVFFFKIAQNSFLFHVSGLSCSSHFDYFESLRGITFLLTQQLQIAEKSCFPLLPMEMLWIAGKRLLSCNNLSSFSPHKMIWRSCPEMKLFFFWNPQKIRSTKEGSQYCCKFKEFQNLVVISVNDDCSMSHKPVVFSSLLLLNVPQFVQIYPLNVFLVWIWGR